MATQKHRLGIRSLFLATCFTFVVLLCSTVNCFYLFQKSIEFLDEEPVSEDNLGPILEYVCDSTQQTRYKQLSRLSTIVRLDEFCQRNMKIAYELSPQFEHSYCAKKIGQLVHDLREVTSDANKDACSERKIKLITEFHNRYISLHPADVERRDPKWRTPEVLTRFFMIYVLNLSSTCRRRLIDSLRVEKAMAELPANSDDTLMDSLLKRLMPLKQTGDFDQIVTGKDLETLLGIETSDDEKTDDEADKQIKTYLKVGPDTGIGRLRTNCIQRYKPIYSQLILPIIDLANLGYTGDFKNLYAERARLKKYDSVQQWYAITQICEVILLVEPLDDPSLNKGQVELVHDPEELKRLLKAQKEAKDTKEETAGTEVEEVEFDTAKVQMFEEDLLIAMESSEIQQIADKIKLDTSTYMRVFEKTVKNLFLDVVKYELKRVFSWFKLPFYG